MKNLFENFNGFADDYLNKMVNLNEMAVFRANALENNIHGFESVIAVATPQENIRSTKEKISGIMLLSDKRDPDKIHFVLYVTQLYNNDDNPFLDLMDFEGTILTRELRRIWEFEPSSVLYGGYISLKNFDDDFDYDEVLDKLIRRINALDLYKKTNRFTKGYITLNIEDFL